MEQSTKRRIALGLAGLALLVSLWSLYVAATCGISYERGGGFPNGTTALERGCEPSVTLEVLLVVAVAGAGLVAAWLSKTGLLLVLGFLAMPLAVATFDVGLLLIGGLLLVAGLLTARIGEANAPGP